jgi:hypothetical protein
VVLPLQENIHHAAAAAAASGCSNSRRSLTKLQKLVSCFFKYAREIDLKLEPNEENQIQQTLLFKCAGDPTCFLHEDGQERWVLVLKGFFLVISWEDPPPSSFHFPLLLRSDKISLAAPSRLLSAALTGARRRRRDLERNSAGGELSYTFRPECWQQQREL